MMSVNNCSSAKLGTIMKLHYHENGTCSAIIQLFITDMSPSLIFCSFQSYSLEYIKVLRRIRDILGKIFIAPHA